MLPQGVLHVVLLNTKQHANAGSVTVGSTKHKKHANAGSVTCGPVKKQNNMLLLGFLSIFVSDGSHLSFKLY